MSTKYPIYFKNFLLNLPTVNVNFTNFMRVINDANLRAKRRGKGGKYKKNSEGEITLAQSEVKKRAGAIFRDWFLSEKLFPRLTFW